MIKADEHRTGRELLLLALLLIGAAIAHSSALDGDFVFDDIRFVPENRALMDLGNLPRYFTDVSTMTSTQGIAGWNDIYRPLRTLSYALDWTIDGPNPYVFRLVNLLWHLAATALAWLLVRRLLGSALLATIGSGIFALHPAQVQAVSWVSSRGDLMAAAFLLGGALCLLREDADMRRTVGGVVLYVFALFSKESAIALLAIVPFYDLLFAESRPRLRYRLYGAMVAVTGGFLALRFSVAIAQEPFAFERWLDAGSALVITIGSLLVPMGLSPFTGDILQGRLTTPVGGVVLAAAAILVALALWRGRKAPRVAFGFLWAAACLAPVSGLLPLKSLAESRFSYLPVLGFGILLALLAGRVGKTGRLGGVVILGLLASWTFEESKIWRNDLDLWAAAESRQEKTFGAPGSMTLVNLGTALAAREKHAEALVYFRRAVKVRHTPMIFVKLAVAHYELGEHEMALKAASTGVRLFPECVPARATYGMVLLNRGHHAEAEVQYRFALSRQPERAHLHRDYGWSLLKQGKLGEALPELTEAVRLAPWDPKNRTHLGKALQISGNLDAAEKEFRAAIQLDERSFEPFLCLGRLNLDMKRPRRALIVLEKAGERAPNEAAVRAERAAAVAEIGEKVGPVVVRELRSATAKLLEIGDPASAAAALNRPGVRRIRDPELAHILVRALMQLKDGAGARKELETFVRLWPNDVRFLADLGTIELRDGRFGPASELLRKALEKDPESSFLYLALAQAYRGAGRENDAVNAARQAERHAQNRVEAENARRFLGEGR